MKKRYIALIALFSMSLFVTHTFAEDHDQGDEASHLHNGDIQPWKQGAEIFVNNDLFEADFGDIGGGLYATDDPGFDVDTEKGAFTPGNWLRFQPIATLQFWDGSAWRSDVPNGERLEITDALDNVSVFRTDSVTDSSGVIGEVDSSGGVHEHINFAIRNIANELEGSTGAYRIEIKLFESEPNSEVSVSAAADPVAIVYNRGLDHEAFEVAVAAADDLTENSVYAEDSGLLDIRSVKAFGKHWKVKLKFIGNNQFELIEVEDASDAH